MTELGYFLIFFTLMYNAVPIQDFHFIFGILTLPVSIVYIASIIVSTEYDDYTAFIVKNR